MMLYGLSHKYFDEVADLSNGALYPSLVSAPREDQGPPEIPEIKDVGICECD